jgi:glyoxylase I family protein
MATHVQTGAAHHLRLTVADPARSRDFYTSLLGFEVVAELNDGVVVSNRALLIGLRTASDPSRSVPGDRADPNRVGLDHLSLSVASRADLEAAARLFDERGVVHGEIQDLGAVFGFDVMMLEDPDGIQLELTALHA